MCLKSNTALYWWSIDLFKWKFVHKNEISLLYGIFSKRKWRFVFRQWWAKSLELHQTFQRHSQLSYCKPNDDPGSKHDSKKNKAGFKPNRKANRSPNIGSEDKEKTSVEMKQGKKANYHYNYFFRAEALSTISTTGPSLMLIKASTSKLRHL